MICGRSASKDRTSTHGYKSHACKLTWRTQSTDWTQHFADQPRIRPRNFGLDTLTQNNRGAIVVITQEVQAELNPNFPSGQAAIDWINANIAAGTIVQPGPAPSYAFSSTSLQTQTDLGEQSIAWYASGGRDPATDIRIVPISIWEAPVSVQVLHEDPTGMARYVQPATPSSAPTSRAVTSI